MADRQAKLQLNANAVISFRSAFDEAAAGGDGAGQDLLLVEIVEICGRQGDFGQATIIQIECAAAASQLCLLAAGTHTSPPLPPCPHAPTLIHSYWHFRCALAVK